MNFGVDTEGYGEVQTLTPANDNQEDAAAGGSESDLPTEPDIEQPQDKTPPIEEAPVTSANTQTAESPVEVPPAPLKVSKPTPPAPKPEPVTPKPATEAKPIRTAQEPGQNGVNGTASTPAGNNNGDRPGKVGDQGSRQGTLDAKGLYGTPGSGTGSNLDLAGWTWDSKPNKLDPYDEEGKIVFEIKVDEEGNIVNVSPIIKTVSPKVVRYYQEQVEALTFSKTKDNASPAPISTGRITIIIRAK